MKTSFLFWSVLINFSFSTFSQTANILREINDLNAQGKNFSFFVGDNRGGYFLFYNSGKSCSYLSYSDAAHKIEELYKANYQIKSMAFTPNGNGWIIITAQNETRYSNISSSLRIKLNELETDKRIIDFVQFSNSNGWILVYDNGYSYEYKEFPQSIGQAVQTAYSNNYPIKSISFTPSGGWCLIYGYNGYESNNVLLEYLNTLYQVNAKGFEIIQVVFTEFNECFILHDYGFYENFLSDNQINNLMSNQSTLSYQCTTIDANNLFINGTKLTPKCNLHGDNILTIHQAYIRDDGEHSSREPAALGIRLAYSFDGINWIDYSNAGELIGQHYEGDESDGKAKLEWEDYECLTYKNYGILDWDAFPNASYLRITLVEGDHESSWWAKILQPFTGSAFIDDIVFDAYANINDLKSGGILKMESAYHEDATLWLQTKRIN